MRDAATQERLGADRPKRRRWQWPIESRRAYSRYMTQVWAERYRPPLPADPKKGLGYLDRGSYRTFEESVARARDPRRKVREQDNLVRYRP